MKLEIINYCAKQTYVYFNGEIYSIGNGGATGPVSFTADSTLVIINGSTGYKCDMSQFYSFYQPTNDNITLYLYDVTNRTMPTYNTNIGYLFFEDGSNTFYTKSGTASPQSLFTKTSGLKEAFNTMVNTLTKTSFPWKIIVLLFIIFIIFIVVIGVIYKFKKQ